MARDDDREATAANFRAARIGAAAAFVVVLGFLMIADALVPTYRVEPFTLGTLVGAILSLLGVEVLRIIRPGRSDE